MKKIDIVRTLSQNEKGLRDYEAIRNVVEHISSNEELQNVENFIDYCNFILTKLEEAEELEEPKKTKFQGICNAYINELKVIIEDYGIPKKGELNTHAKRILNILETNYSDILNSQFIKTSYEIVKSHYKEGTHSREYGMHLNHLNEVLVNAQRARKAAYHSQTRLEDAVLA